MSLKMYLRFCAAGVLTVYAALVSAQSSCDSYLSLYDSDPVLYSYVPQIHPECFGASQQTSTVSINQTSFVQISTISSALSNRFLASPPTNLTGLSTGRAAATPGKRWNVWGNLTSNNTEQSYMRPAPANSRIDISNDALTTVLGADMALSSTMAAGVSAAFDRASGDSRVAGAVQNNLLNEGYMIAPYIGLSLNKTLAFDASAGWGQGKLSQSGGVSAEADRWFAGANLNYSSWIGNTQISGKLSWMHGEEKYDKAKTPTIAAVTGTDAKNKIDQWRLGAQASWWMNGVMPYLGLSYLTERRSTTLIGAIDPIGKDAWLFSIGANFLSLSSGITGGVAYEQELDRTNQDNYRLIANIGLRF
jgi:hypothetical protein